MPGSKSLTNRALIAASLADGDSLLRGVLLAEDTRLMVEALWGMGIAITLDETSCVAEVSGCRGFIPNGKAELACGNAGTVMRFGLALSALGHGVYTLDGIERMRQRPIGPLVEVLQSLGAGVEYLGVEGYPPLSVRASGLSGGQVAFHSPQSSQLISALMLVAPYASRDVMIEVSGGLPSVPYIKMTSGLMDRFGVAVVEQFEDHGARLIVAAPQRYSGTVFPIEPDASNATYFLAAAAVAGGRVTVQGLGRNSVQGDARFVEILAHMGCHVERAANQLSVVGPSAGQKLRGIDVDLNDMPDTAQTLAVVAMFAEGPTTIRNVANLRVKETDRISAMNRELTKLGATIDEHPDGLRIDPPEQITPAAIDTYNDHRMAMSFAVAGLRVPGLIINDPECCAKTFPDFFERLEGLCGS